MAVIVRTIRIMRRNKDSWMQQGLTSSPRKQGPEAETQHSEDKYGKEGMTSLLPKNITVADQFHYLEVIMYPAVGSFDHADGPDEPRSTNCGTRWPPEH